MRRVSLAIALAFLAGACNDDDDGGGPGATDFDAFVTDLIQDGTTETGEPVEIGGTTFAFDEDETFDDLLPPDGGPVVGP